MTPRMTLIIIKAALKESLNDRRVDDAFDKALETLCDKCGGAGFLGPDPFGGLFGLTLCWCYECNGTGIEQNIEEVE